MNTCGTESLIFFKNSTGKEKFSTFKANHLTPNFILWIAFEGQINDKAIDARDHSKTRAWTGDIIETDDETFQHLEPQWKYERELWLTRNLQTTGLAPFLAEACLEFLKCGMN